MLYLSGFELYSRWVPLKLCLELYAPRFSLSYPMWRRLLRERKLYIVSLRVLTFSNFEGNKFIVFRVEVDLNGHVDAGELCLAITSPGGSRF